MPAHHWPPVAVHAKSATGVLVALLNVVRFTWAGFFTDRAGKLLDPRKVQALFLVYLVIHAAALSMLRLFALSVR
jgi:hypothetical protein